MKKKERYHLVCLLLIIGAIYQAGAANGEFEIVFRPLDGNTEHIHYLLPYEFPMSDGKMLDWIRQWPPTTPGDYFRWPAGATIIPLSDSEYAEVRNLLHETISGSFYDDILLQDLIGFEYAIHNGSVNRREYYLSYARADTVYVISGWLGSFFSFYRATPGDFRYSVGDLQENVEILSSTYVKVPASEFTISDSEDNYFLEYIDKDHMTRVRNYLVKAKFLPDDLSKDKAEKYSIYNVSPLGDRESYNLIEITKFIDPEVIP